MGTRYSLSATMRWREDQSARLLATLSRRRAWRALSMDAKGVGGAPRPSHPCSGCDHLSYRLRALDLLMLALGEGHRLPAASSQRNSTSSGSTWRASVTSTSHIDRRR